MKRQLRLFFAVAIVAVALFGCKKEDCPEADDITKISGVWVGKYCGSCTDTALTNVDVTFEINSTGEIIVHDGLTTPTAPDAGKAKGTWTLDGTTFRATFKFLTLDVNRNIVATMSSDFESFSGTRGQNGATTGSGVIKMVKQ